MIDTGCHSLLIPCPEDFAELDKLFPSEHFLWETGAAHCVGGVSPFLPIFQSG
jgi:hypothetical protein